MERWRLFWITSIRTVCSDCLSTWSSSHHIRQAAFFSLSIARKCTPKRFCNLFKWHDETITSHVILTVLKKQQRQSFDLWQNCHFSAAWPKKKRPKYCKVFISGHFYRCLHVSLSRKTYSNKLFYCISLLVSIVLYRKESSSTAYFY